MATDTIEYRLISRLTMNVRNNRGDLQQYFVMKYASLIQSTMFGSCMYNFSSVYARMWYSFADFIPQTHLLQRIGFQLAEKTSRDINVSSWTNRHFKQTGHTYCMRKRDDLYLLYCLRNKQYGKMHYIIRKYFSIAQHCLVLAKSCK